MESLYFLALILCPYYSVPKCTLFGTTSLKNEFKKEGIFQPSSQIPINIRNDTTSAPN